MRSASSRQSCRSVDLHSPKSTKRVRQATARLHFRFRFEGIPDRGFATDAARETYLITGKLGCYHSTITSQVLADQIVGPISRDLIVKWISESLLGRTCSDRCHVGRLRPGNEEWAYVVAALQ